MSWPSHLTPMAVNQAEAAASARPHGGAREAVVILGATMGRWTGTQPDRWVEAGGQLEPSERSAQPEGPGEARAGITRRRFQDCRPGSPRTRVALKWQPTQRRGMGGEARDSRTTRLGRERHREVVLERRPAGNVNMAC
jgi:hypothetical protein